VGALPVSVAAVNDFDLVVEGLAAMLGRFPDRVAVRDAIVVGEPLRADVDVALFDMYGRGDDALEIVRQLASEPMIGSVALFSIEMDRQLMVDATDAGAAGFVSKGLAAVEVVSAIEQIVAGGYVEASARKAVPNSELVWPGKSLGLSARESEVLALVAAGLTNGEIARTLFVGLETVKTHVRSLYAKLDLRNRVEASRFVATHRDFRGPAFGQIADVDSPVVDQWSVGG
jgi:DNA-binding NarL/FixJ family response regulator